MTYDNAIAIIGMLDAKIAQERDKSKEHNKQAKTLEAGIKEYYLRIADFHMGVAYGLEIAREAVIRNMED